MRIHLYVEGGGGAGNAAKIRCREAFREFLEKAGLQGHMPRITAAGGRQEAFTRFQGAHANPLPGTLPVLLLDSEGPVKPGHGPWQHLSTRDPMPKPQGATDDRCYLMVQLMESWFLADPETVKEYFGAGVVAKHLKPVADIEAVAKKEVIARLESSSARRMAGKFSKAGDSFELLARIQPAKVAAASRHAKRLLDFLRANST